MVGATRNRQILDIFKSGAKKICWYIRNEKILGLKDRDANEWEGEDQENQGGERIPEA